MEGKWNTCKKQNSSVSASKELSGSTAVLLNLILQIVLGTKISKVSVWRLLEQKELTNYRHLLITTSLEASRDDDFKHHLF